jgi:hypothetical protein
MSPARTVCKAVDAPTLPSAPRTPVCVALRGAPADDVARRRVVLYDMERATVIAHMLRSGAVCVCERDVA